MLLSTSQVEASQAREPLAICFIPALCCDLKKKERHSPIDLHPITNQCFGGKFNIESRAAQYGQKFINWYLGSAT